MEIKVKEVKNISSPDKAANIFRSILSVENENDQRKEHFWAVGLDARNTIKYVELVSLGTLNANLVHPRETFRLAILKSVACIMVAHNHPSGESEPSEDDLEITKRLRKAGEILGIELIDHIIIGKNFYSFKENNLI